MTLNLAVQLSKGKLNSIQVPKPTLASPDDILLEVTHAGVCGTDLKIIDGTFPAAAETVIMGHEISGIISEKGENIDHLNVGDRLEFDIFYEYI